MSSSTLLRWSGLAAIVAGVLEALVAVLDFLLFPDNLARTSVVTMSTYQILQAVTLAWQILFLWALVGLYGRQSDKAGVLGFAGFLIFFVGYILIYSTQWGFFIFGPDLARAAPTFLDSEIPSGVLGIVAHQFPFALAALGLILFAVASLRAKVFPRWAVVLLLVAPVVGGAGLFVGLGFLGGGGVFDTGIAWMGYALWAQKRELAGQRAVTAAS